ncbi:MAG: hypothetical protein IJ875_01635, partial [Solobacterium sp.]|nr:hypothetical protein [Solobacterium sp.]
MNTRYSDKRPLYMRVLTVLTKFIVLGVACIFTAFPFIWMIISSLKTKADILNTDVFFPPNPQWEN